MRLHSRIISPLSVFSRIIKGCLPFVALIFISVSLSAQHTVTMPATPYALQNGSAQMVGRFNPQQMLRLVLALQPPHMQEEEAFLREFLRDGAADAPAHPDGQIAVVDRLAVRQLGVPAVGLPLGGGADDDGDLFTVWAHVHTFPVAITCSQ